MKPQKIIIALSGLVAIFLFFYFDLKSYLTLAALKTNLLGLFALVPVLYNEFKKQEQK